MLVGGGLCAVCVCVHVINACHVLHSACTMCVGGHVCHHVILVDAGVE